MRYTVVIPVFDEAETVRDVLEEVAAVLIDPSPLEVVVVDDGSRDSTQRELRAVLAARPELRALSHDRRCGKSAALLTGMRAARGDWVLTMDGDGQNDPRDALRLLDAAPAGEVEPSLIAGVRQDRRASAWRRLASRFANGVRGAVLRDDCPDSACGLKLIRRDAFLAMPFFDGMHRFLPALCRAQGRGVALVTVGDRPRRAGRSKYGDLSRAAAGIADLLGVFWMARRTTIPARVATLDRETDR